MIVAARILSYMKPGRVREVSWEPRSRRQQNSHFSTIAELSMLHREITQFFICVAFNFPDMMGLTWEVASMWIPVSALQRAPITMPRGFQFYARSSSELATPPQSSLTNYQAASVTNSDFLNPSKAACAQRHVRIFLLSWTTAVMYITRAHAEYVNR